MFIVIQEETQDFLDTPRGLGVGLKGGHGGQSQGS